MWARITSDNFRLYLRLRPKHVNSVDKIENLKQLKLRESMIEPAPFAYGGTKQ